MKKLINDVRTVVPEMLEGLAMLDPGIALLEGQTVAVRADVAEVKARGEVALVSGGGAGHEPAHAGFIGPGLLTAAVVGDVFTSPSTDAVLAAIEAVSGQGGVLLIVKNYTGDRLNFGLAAQIARSRGHEVEMVVVADDAALAARGDHAGRRGLAGTVLVHKIAGAAAASGASLQQVKQAALDAIEVVSTMGVALTSCTVPAAGTPGFNLNEDEVELGLGIHGEPGIRKARIEPADALVDTLLDQLEADLQLRAGDRVALLVNNLGGTPSQELAIVARAAVSRLTNKGVVIERAWSGAFLTALEMAGVSLSLMKLNDARLAALDAPARAPAWPAATGKVRAAPARLPVPKAGAEPVRREANASHPAAKVLLAIADALEAAEPELTRLDQQVGDGDLGISLARGSMALRDQLSFYPLEHLPGTLRAMSATLRRSLGGTSGPLYAAGLLSAATVLEEAPAAFGRALAAAARSISEIGGAGAGDCTMLDAMIPAAQALDTAQQRGDSLSGSLAQAAAAAQAGAENTSFTLARRGRASYLGERARGHVDPGARAVALWLDAIASFLSGRAP